MKYTAGIIGAGSIGSLKPDNIDKLNETPPLTHAHAISTNPNIELKWLYDTNYEKTEQACKKWNIKRVADIYDKDNQVDIIVISAPTEHHLNIIRNITGDQDHKRKFEYKPKLIILEKPVGKNLDECTRIDWLSKQSGIPIVVNYPRRFVPELQNIATEIIKNNIQNIVFYYTRGFIRDGSHAIDILNWMAGVFKNGSIIGNHIEDYPGDNTYAVNLEYTKCPNVFMVPCHGDKFDIFEMHIMIDDRRLVFGDHFKSMFEQIKCKENTYGDYYSMPNFIKLNDAYSYKHDLKNSLKYLYEEVVQYLNKEIDKFSSDMNNALRVHNVINRLLIQKEQKE